MHHPIVWRDFKKNAFAIVLCTNESDDRLSTKFI